MLRRLREERGVLGCWGVAVRVGSRVGDSSGEVKSEGSRGQWVGRGGMVVNECRGVGLEPRGSCKAWVLRLVVSWLGSDVDGGVAKGLEAPLDVACVICIDSGIPFLTHGRTV